MTDNITTPKSNEDKGYKKRVSEIEILQNKYDTISAKIKKLYNLYAESEDELLLETIKENQADLNNAYKQLKLLQDENNAINNKKKKRTINDFKNLRSQWEELTITEKRAALRICITKIVLNDDAIDIHYNM